MHFQQFLGVVTYFRIGVAKVLPKIAGNHHYVFPAFFGSSTGGPLIVRFFGSMRKPYYEKFVL